jgi:hypothetical protein
MMRRRTLVKSQDMKTGEFAFLHELIVDGYYPNLWVLPKNYEPPIPQGESIRLPLEPIFNFAPPNTKDEAQFIMANLTSAESGYAIPLPTGFGSAGMPALAVA